MDSENRFNEIIAPPDEATARAFDEAVRRGVKKGKRARRGRAAWMSAAAAAVVAGSFVLGLNFSPAFAMAMGRVPLLRDIAKLVTFDKGLKMAVENQYFQPVGQAQEKDGMIVNIGGIMADDGDLTVFYDVSGAPANLEPHASGQIKYLSGDPILQGATSRGVDAPDGTRSLQFALIDANLPDAVLLDMNFYAVPGDESHAPALLKTFEFRLDIDASLRKPGVPYVLNRSLKLADGVNIVLDQFVVYPTSARLSFHEDPANTQKINNISFTLTNERGEKFQTSGGFGCGIVLMESPFFSNSKHLTLRCDSASFLPKGDDTITIDPATGRVCDQNASWLIPVSVSRADGYLRLTYTIPKELTPDGLTLGEPFTMPVTDDAGSDLTRDGLHMEDDENNGVSSFTLLIKDAPITGLLHVPVGISPPVAVHAEEIKIK